MTDGSELVFTIKQEEDGDWTYGDWETPFHGIGESQFIRFIMVILSYRVVF